MMFKPDWDPNEDSQWKDDSTVFDVIIVPIVCAIGIIGFGVALIHTVHHLFG